MPRRGGIVVPGRVVKLVDGRYIGASPSGVYGTSDVRSTRVHKAMMSTPVATLAERIDQDHRRLRSALAQLLVVLEEPIPEGSFLEWKLEFLSRLRAFQHNLLVHFDLEEEGGFMDTVVRVAPQYARQVEQLLEEHASILKDLERSIEIFKGADSPVSSRLHRVRERVRELITVHEAHESVEHELLQNVYNQDLGTGD